MQNDEEREPTDDRHVMGGDDAYAGGAGAPYGDDRHVSVEGADDGATELDGGRIDLRGELDGEEDELLPPEEENEAREINAGTIFAVIFIAIALIMLIVVLAGGKRKKKDADGELDKAGSKWAMEFKEKGAQTEEALAALPEGDEAPIPAAARREEEDVDAILDTLPPTLQLPPQPAPGQAPVSRVGSTGGGASRSTRPDTRNSKSPRRIDGLKGQSYAPADTNQNIVSAIMNGSYTPQSAAGRERMTREEYIAEMLNQTQGLQNQLYGANGAASGFGGAGAYGTAGGSMAAAYQQNKEQFYSSGAGAGAGSGDFLSYNALWDGTIISGALVTAINTDNPGVVIARVTENVWSSYDHSFLLIPEGSLLYATYNSSVSYGQDKVQVAWNLLIRPDGYRLTLGNMNGVNAQGASGYKGRVNNHPFETMKALGMIAVYSMIQTEIVNDINSQNNEYLQNAMTDVYAEANKIGNKIIDRALDIKPRITIKAGTEIKLITNTPLELPLVQIQQATRKYIRTR